MLSITNSYLYLRLLIGNDIAVRLTSDKENIFLKHGQSEVIQFKTQIITNPFCNIECNYDFINVGSGENINKGNFTIKPTKSLIKRYTINATEIGSGQELYRFNIKCNNKKTYLCHTNQDVKTRDILITLDYDLNEQEKNIKEKFRKYLVKTLEELNYENYLNNKFVDIISELEGITDTEELKININKTNFLIINFNETLKKQKQLWDEQDYINIEFNEDKMITINKEINKINKTINSELSLYNSLIINLNSLRNYLVSINNINVTNTTINQIDNAVKEYNNYISDFNKKDLLINKAINLESLKIKIENISIENGTIILNETINKFNFTIINLDINYTNTYIILNEPENKCCFYGKCKRCCDKNCNDKLYPIILLHGHAFNKDISAEYSLDTFNLIQIAMEKDDYINAGSIISNNDNIISGILGKTNYPVTFKASYYFDIYKNTGKGIMIETKKDNLDTYAIRLKDIIENVRYKTGKDKVIIIAHSMGGLVARRYLQVFGNDSLDKIILIGTPNNGIEKERLKLCNLFGSVIECENMYKESLFMNKLLNANSQKVSIYNIIGIGCEMDASTGDGIIKKEEAYLEYAKNYYINGNCEGPFNYLHEDLVNINKYPKIYEIINEILG